MGSSFLQLSPEEEIKIRSCQAAIEIEERKTEMEREEMGRYIRSSMLVTSNDNHSLRSWQDSCAWGTFSRRAK